MCVCVCVIGKEVLSEKDLCVYGRSKNPPSKKRHALSTWTASGWTLFSDWLLRPFACSADLIARDIPTIERTQPTTFFIFHFPTFSLHTCVLPFFISNIFSQIFTPHQQRVWLKEKDLVLVNHSRSRRLLVSTHRKILSPWLTRPCPCDYHQDYISRYFNKKHFSKLPKELWIWPRWITKQKSWHHRPHRPTKRSNFISINIQL